MPTDRTDARNVKLFIRDEPDLIGGLVANVEHAHITNADFLDCLSILVVPYTRDSQVGNIESPCYHVLWHNVQSSEINTLSDLDHHPPGGVVIANDESFVQPGVYVVHPLCSDSRQPYEVCIYFADDSAVGVQVSSEPFIDRVISQSITGRASTFRDAVRARDGGCVITGAVNPGARRNNWRSWEAGHIWPLEAGSEWVRQSAHNSITDQPAGTAPGEKQNSPQNGMLMRSHIHSMFDDYTIGVNPERGYKVIHFGEDIDNVGGKTLAQSARQNGINGVRDSLLRWHFRQCVFANMRGAGEPLWDYGDDEPGDPIAQITKEDTSGRRLYLELAHRLAAAR